MEGLGNSKRVSSIIPVIIAGGSGTRLWPFSREHHPKPFAPLFQKNLMEQTLERVVPLGNPLIVTSEKLKALMERTVSKVCKNHPCQILYEPIPRNTLVAITLATLWVQKHFGEDATLAIFPADHWIGEVDEFWENIQTGTNLAQEGWLVTLGIRPNLPHTGYGYIEKGPSLFEKKGFRVKAFHEKPDLETAKSYIERGFLWNSGIFIGQAKTWQKQIKRFFLDLWQEMTEKWENQEALKALFPTLPQLSIDYAIMEKLGPEELSVVPATFSWSDVGTWDSVANLPESEKRTHQTWFGQNNTVFGKNQKVYQILGVSDLVVADTEDALLICHKNHTHKVGDIYRFLKQEAPQVVEHHVSEMRPWGEFRVLLETPYCKVKEILVLPGAQLSYQSHSHRAEQWIVVKGEASILLNDVWHIKKIGESIHIPVQAKHRLANRTNQDLVVIEVQTGIYFGEDDIQRYEDQYGRLPNKT